MTKTSQISISILLLTVLALCSFLFVRSASASAPGGLPSTIATSSNPALAANTATVIIASSTCNARIISTATTTLMLTFTDKDTPTATFGVFQPASTTVVYDSGQYGCGQVKALSNLAGQITVQDAR